MDAFGTLGNLAHLPAPGSCPSYWQMSSCFHDRRLAAMLRKVCPGCFGRCRLSGQAFQAHITEEHVFVCVCACFVVPSFLSRKCYRDSNQSCFVFTAADAGHVLCFTRPLRGRFSPHSKQTCQLRLKSPSSQVFGWWSCDTLRGKRHLPAHACLVQRILSTPCWFQGKARTPDWGA